MSLLGARPSKTQQVFTPPTHPSLHSPAVEDVIHYEALPTAFNDLMAARGYPAIALRALDKRVNGRAAAARLNISHLAPSTIASINDEHARDFAAFGYATIDPQRVGARAAAAYDAAPRRGIVIPPTAPRVRAPGRGLW